MSDTQLQIVELHPLAPLKPECRAHYNGYGVCCAAEPCPVAYVFLRQFRGKCRALLWQDETKRYVCGLVVTPDRYVSMIPKRMRERFGGFIAVRIATGVGCDFAAEILEKDPLP